MFQRLNHQKGKDQEIKTTLISVNKRLRIGIRFVNLKRNTVVGI